MKPPRSYRVLTGPTASGKTDWLVRRSRRTPLAVISADSRQVYCHMDIGTGKISTSTAETVPHFCLDLLNPLKKSSVYQYFSAVSTALRQLETWEGEVWLSGGTGLWIRAVVDGLTLGAAPLAEAERLRTLQRIEERGSRAVSQELGLEVRDPDNPRRVLRAVEAALNDPGRAAEICDRFGIPEASESSLGNAEPAPSVEGWRCEAIAVLDPGYEQLVQRIERRVAGMFAAGLLDEAARLMEMGFGEAEVVREGIGYREALAVVRGEMDVGRAIELTVIRTRQYAKRQRTYFRGRGWPFYREEELPFD